MDKTLLKRNQFGMQRGQAEERRWGRAKLLRAGQLIRKLREEAGLPAKRVCAEIGMAVGQLSDIERGIQQISLRRAYQLSTVLKTPFTGVVEQVLQDRLEAAGFKGLRVVVVVDRPEE